MIRRNIIFLFLIFVLAFALRIYALDSHPSPFLDEMTNGYNAYSILSTGKDEYGKQLPLILRSFDDYRPALFVYFTIPFIVLFDLTLYAVRMPSVVLGLISIVFVYVLCKEIFYNKRNNNIIGLISAFLLAISPWHIYTSRSSNEVNISLTFFILGLTAFLYAINRKLADNKSKIAYFGSIFLFAAVFYSYNAIKLFIPLFVLSILILFYKSVFTKRKIAVASILLGILLAIPFIQASRSKEIALRMEAVSIINQNPEIIKQSSQNILRYKESGDLVGQVLNNRRILIAQKFLVTALDNFNPSWMFVGVLNKSFMVPYVAPFYLFELPLLLIGLYFLIKDKDVTWKFKSIFALLIFISVVPSGMASESPHINRTHTMLPGLIILQGLGLYFLIKLIKDWKTPYRITVYLGMMMIIGTSLIGFIHSYFIELPYVYGKEYQVGIMEALNYAKQNESKYSKIIVSNANPVFTQSYMYYLFVKKYDPKKYLSIGGTNSGFFNSEHFIGKYQFLGSASISEKSLSSEPTLVIMNADDKELEKIRNVSVTELKSIKHADGKDSVKIYQVKMLPPLL